MTSKKAQSEKEARRHEERVRGALRWSETAPKPDVMPPIELRDLTTGWTFNTHTRNIDVACSSPVFHAIGRIDRVTSQNPIRLYSTRRLALLALRASMEREFAEALAKVDALLEAE